MPSLDTTIDKAIDTYKVCEANDEEPNWDCISASKSLKTSLILNAISIYAGWSHAGISNGALEGQDTTNVKRNLMKY